MYSLVFVIARSFTLTGALECGLATTKRCELKYVLKHNKKQQHTAELEH